MDRCVTTIDLLRHGEPAGGRKYRGQTDDPLSEKGWAQMRAAVAGAAAWDAVVSSTLSRCSAFARELAAHRGLPLELDERLKELGLGAWEGRTAAEVAAGDATRLMRFWADPLSHAPEGAEPLERFRARVQAAWQHAATRHVGRRVLLVAHAGVIRMILGLVLDMPLERLFRIAVPSAGLSRVELETRGPWVLPRLVFHAGAPAGE